MNKIKTFIITTTAIALIMLFSANASAGSILGDIIFDVTRSVEKGDRQLSKRQVKALNLYLTKNEQKRLTDNTSVKCRPWNNLADPFFADYKTCRLSGGIPMSVLDWETAYDKKIRLQNVASKEKFGKLVDL